MRAEVLGCSNFVDYCCGKADPDTGLDNQGGCRKYYCTGAEGFEDDH